MTRAQQFKLFSWSLGGLVVALAFLAWYPMRLSDGKLGNYELFPLLGLTAFSLMWSHYVLGGLRRRFGFEKSLIERYFTVTSLITLVLILLHPGIFFYQLYADGLGTPPGSYLAVYTDTVSRFALMLGTVSLCAFLSFELRHKFKTARWWRYVEYVNVFAMFAIFYHALRLGGEVASGWYRYVWFFYAVTLIIALTYQYQSKRKTTAQWTND